MDWTPGTPGTYRLELDVVNATRGHGVSSDALHLEAASTANPERQLETELQSLPEV